MARKKSTPHKTRKPVTFQSLPPDERDVAELEGVRLPSEKTWDDIIKRLEKKHGPEKKTKKSKVTKRKAPASKKKGKTCMTLLELARHFPDVARQVCFHPAVSTFNSVVGGVPSSKRKVATWFK